jgi:hypothetical protein
MPGFLFAPHANKFCILKENGAPHHREGKMKL